MSRIDQGHWHFATSVGATATVTAVRRALTSRSPDVLVDDLFAGPPVRGRVPSTPNGPHDPEAVVSCCEDPGVGD